MLTREVRTKVDYLILDSAGNAVACFEDEVKARATVHAIVAVEPEAADSLVLLAYDEDGLPVGNAVRAVDVPPAFEITTQDVFQALLKPVQAMKLPDWTQMVPDWAQTKTFKTLPVWEPSPETARA